MNYWLMKAEPVGDYSIDDLKRDKTQSWDGVRNYQARNFMRDQMKKGDMVLFYHSNSDPSGVVGIAKVVKESHVDHTQFDKKDSHFDPKATKDNPRWFMVAVGFVKKFPRMVTLEELKKEKLLTKMLVVQKGQRLSVQPVDKKHFEKVVQMAKS